MLKALWEYILRLFGITKTPTTDRQMQDNEAYMASYLDISSINFTAIFASKLTTLAVSESTASISGSNARAEYMNDCLSAVWSKLKRISARFLGTGGCAVVPYVQDGSIYFDIVPQSRVIINNKQGDKILSATILADQIRLNDRSYYRWVDYRIENNTAYITNKVTNETGAPAAIDRWEGIQDMCITGVNRVPFAFFKSPVDNRRGDEYYGVPVTYGCESIIEDIYKCLGQIADEFALKEVRLFADERTFKIDPKTGKRIVPSKLFIAAHGDEKGSMMDIFSPDIRDSSYYNRLNNLFELLEKAVGTSRGILTALESRGATATEIKAGIYDTYAFVADIRKAIEDGIKDYMYACEVLVNCYALTPQGDYELSFDWSYSLIESSTETWSQLKDAQAIGIKSRAELRQWLNPNETMEQSQKAVDEIRKNEPTLADMLGGDNGAE